MPIMSVDSVRVQDPILTSVVTGYGDPEFVGNFLFPEVEVKARAGKVIEFSRDDFVAYSSRRAPGAPMRSVAVRYGSRNYEIVQDALQGELPIEHAEEAENNMLPFDLQEETVLKTKRAIDLGLEIEQAAIASDSTKYPAANTVALSGASQWSDPASNPTTQIFTWNEGIRRQIGVFANSLVLSPKAFLAARTNPNVTNQFRGVSSESITTEMLAKIWNLSRGVRVGTALKEDPATGELVDIWDNNAVLSYVPTQVSNRRQPSYGYTYRLRGYPLAEEPYYDRNHRTWYFPVIAERSPQLTGLAAGFLARNVAA